MMMAVYDLEKFPSTCCNFTFQVCIIVLLVMFYCFVHYTRLAYHIFTLNVINIIKF